MSTLRRSALFAAILAALLVPAAMAAASPSAATDRSLPRGAGMWLRDPGQTHPYLQDDVTNGPKVNVKWWVPSRAYTRVKFTFSPFGAARTFTVRSSLGGSFKIAVAPPAPGAAGSRGFVLPPEGWYRLKVTMTLYKGRSVAGRTTQRMYVDLRAPTLQATDPVTTIARDDFPPYPYLDPSDWDKLQVQFNDNLPQSAQSSVAAGLRLAGIYYVKSAATGSGLKGTLHSTAGAKEPLTGYLDYIFATGQPTDLYLDPAKDAAGAYLPGTYEQQLVFADAAGNRATETLVFTVLPAPALPAGRAIE